MIDRWGRAALVMAGVSLAFGLSACEDPAAKAKAEAEVKAKAAAVEQDRKLQETVAHNVECLSALRWQKAALTGKVAGSLDIYAGYYQENLEKALGDRVIVNEAPKPTLSRSTLEDYLNWAYADDVKTKFTAGKDGNGDGKMTAVERSGQGFNIVASCILEVAEAGKGPLAGKDKLLRMQRIQALRHGLKDKGA